MAVILNESVLCAHTKPGTVSARHLQSLERQQGGKCLSSILISRMHNQYEKYLKPNLNYLSNLGRICD